MLLACENFVIHCDDFIDIIKYKDGKKRKVKYGIGIHFIANNQIFERRFLYDTKEERDVNYNALLDSYTTGGR